MSTSIIKQSLKDWVEICNETDTKYCVIGSVVLFAISKDFNRNPNDLDVLYDARNENNVKSALIRKGYKHIYIEENSNLFTKKLDRFTKGKSIIEPRRARFSQEGIFIDLILPIKILPKLLRPHVVLAFGKEMSRAKTYKIGRITFNGLSKEASFVALSVFKDRIANKNKLGDLEYLSKKVDQNFLQKIYQDNPGIYFKTIPLVTTKTLILQKFLNIF